MQVSVRNMSSIDNEEVAGKKLGIIKAFQLMNTQLGQKFHMTLKIPFEAIKVAFFCVPIAEAPLPKKR